MRSTADREENHAPIQRPRFCRPRIGDAERDLVAGAAVGCALHLVRTGKAAAMSAPQIEALLARLPGTRVHADLAAFADDLIHREFVARGMSGESDSGYGRLA